MTNLVERIENASEGEFSLLLQALKLSSLATQGNTLLVESTEKGYTAHTDIETEKHGTPSPMLATMGLAPFVGALQEGIQSGDLDRDAVEASHSLFEGLACVMGTVLEVLDEEVPQEEEEGELEGSVEELMFMVNALKEIHELTESDSFKGLPQEMQEGILKGLFESIEQD